VLDINFNKNTHIQKYQKHHFTKCLLLFRTNTPNFFAKEEELLLKYYLQNKNINYYILLEEQKIIAAGGYGLNKKENTIDLTWGMVNSFMHKKGYGKILLNYRIENIIKEFPGRNITLNTSQKTFKFYQKFGFKTQKITKNFYRKGLDRYDMLKPM
tara:strand:- start:258 stop:725 length:468 start_codon:yes stop_codon:yes gene_type:complete